MYSIGECSLTCVDAIPFNYTVATQDTVFNITEISNFERQKYCIQLGCVNGDSSEDKTVLGFSDLTSSIISYYYPQQQINDTYVGYNLIEDKIRTIDDNEDVFVKQHYDKYHMNYHYNARYATGSDSPNPDNDFMILDPEEIAKISIGKYYIDSPHFEFYTRYRFDKNYPNFHFKMVLQIGAYFIIFDFENNVRLRMRFASMLKGKLDVFYSHILYDFKDDLSTVFAINVENKYGEFTRVTLSLNDEEDYTFEIEEFMIPFSYCSVISNMYVKFRGPSFITVRTNFDVNTTYLFSNNYYPNKLLKFDINHDEIQSDNYKNIVYNVGCKYNITEHEDCTIETLVGGTHATIPQYQLLYGDRLSVYIDKTLHINVDAQSVLFKEIILMNQSDYIAKIVSDDTSNDYHSLQFTEEKTYLAFYKYRWNDIRACYGFKERFTIRGLNLFQRIEANSAKYSIYGINFVISTELDNSSPNSYRIRPDYTGNEFQTTNIIPLDEIDDIKYISAKSYRHIEIQGILNDLRTKFNITDTSIKHVYLIGVSIVYIENGRYFELSSNSNHTLKIIDITQPLPVAISIEY